MDVLVISISNPLLIGIYENEKLIKTYSQEGKTSDILPSLFDKILKNYQINRIFYVNSPGSYMAIKVAYVFLKTISISQKIEFYATNGFYFNNNSAIKALGKKYFKQKNGEVIIEMLEENEKIEDFKLPSMLDANIFTDETLPIYHLPAV